MKHIPSKTLQLQSLKSPHIRYPETVRTMMGDVCLALLPLVVMATIYYGWRVLILCAISVVTCDLADVLCLLIQGKRREGNFSGVVTGLIIALLLPASAPYYVVVAAGLFAILIVKHPFGGLGNNIFNPACAGVSFAMICWPSALINYPKPEAFGSSLELFGEVTAKLSPGPASVLKEFSVPFVIKNYRVPMDTVWEILIGNFAGPMGATCILVIVCCAVMLLLRGTISWHVPVSFVSTAALFSAILPRLEVTGDYMSVTRMTGVFLELVVGTLLFSAVFVATDPVTNPTFPQAKILYGIGCGLLTMLFRYFGQFPEGLMFSILIMNGISGFLDKIFLDYQSGNGMIKQYIARRKAYLATEEYQNLLAEIAARTQYQEEQRQERREERAEKRAIRQAAAQERREERAEVLRIKRAERAEVLRIKREEMAVRRAEEAERRRIEREERLKREAEEKAAREEAARLAAEEAAKAEEERAAAEAEAQAQVQNEAGAEKTPAGTDTDMEAAEELAPETSQASEEKAAEEDTEKKEEAETELPKKSFVIEPEDQEKPAVKPRGRKSETWTKGDEEASPTDDQEARATGAQETEIPAGQETAVPGEKEEQTTREEKPSEPEPEKPKASSRNAAKTSTSWGVAPEKEKKAETAVKTETEAKPQPEPEVVKEEAKADQRPVRAERWRPRRSRLMDTEEKTKEEPEIAPELKEEIDKYGVGLVQDKKETESDGRDFDPSSLSLHIYDAPSEPQWDLSGASRKEEPSEPEPEEKPMAYRRRPKRSGWTSGDIPAEGRRQTPKRGRNSGVSADKEGVNADSEGVDAGKDRGDQDE